MITYLTGDATQPVKKPALIMHVCNDVGGWGRGFVLALSKRWPEVEAGYRGLAHTTGYDLARVQYVVAEHDQHKDPLVIVANMIAQHGTSAAMGPPIRYDALAACLKEIDDFASRFFRGRQEHLTIHAPRIGCGLAGGSWSVVEPLIEHYLKDREVYVYDLPGEIKE